MRDEFIDDEPRANEEVEWDPSVAPIDPNTDKCIHGIRKAKGDVDGARYCTGCNPGSGRIMAPPVRVPQVHDRHSVDDVTEYLDQPVYMRLVEAERMMTL